MEQTMKPTDHLAAMVEAHPVTGSTDTSRARGVSFSLPPRPTSGPLARGAEPFPRKMARTA